MSHQGLGQLLEDFAIGEAADYYLLAPGKQSTFVSRLYSELEHHVQEGLGRIEQGGGLKLHFRVEPDEDEGFRNLPDDVFFRKACFYANRMLVTFPFRETNRTPRATVRHGNAIEFKRDKEILAFGKYKAGRDGYGGTVEEVGKNHHLYRSEFDAFLHLLCSAQPFLKDNFLTIMPSYHPEAKKLRIGSKAYLGLIPANFQRPALRRQFEEAGLEEYGVRPGDTPSLYLPYFSNLSSSEVLSVRREQSNTYDRFQNQLSQLLAGLKGVKTEDALLVHLKEINDEVLKLMDSYSDIHAAARNNKAELVVKLFQIGLVPCVSASLVPVLGAVLGEAGLAFVNYLAKKAAAAAPIQKLKVDNPEVFLMWQLVDLDKKHSHRKAG